jgi:hypothetical protein
MTETDTRTTAVLADVFKRADQRAGDLAAVANQARIRGLTCEQGNCSMNPTFKAPI